MELGDDYHTGVEINAVEYEARTLRSDLVTADGDLLDLGEVPTQGQMAEPALGITGADQAVVYALPVALAGPSLAIVVEGIVAADRSKSTVLKRYIRIVKLSDRLTKGNGQCRCVSHYQ